MYANILSMPLPMPMPYMYCRGPEKIVIQRAVVPVYGLTPARHNVAPVLGGLSSLGHRGVVHGHLKKY